MSGMGPTQPNEQYFNKGLWGWDGSYWRKVRMVWGFSAAYGELEAVTVTVPGLNRLTFSTVPVGEVWRVTNLSLYATTANPTSAYWYPVVAGAAVYVAGQVGLVASQIYPHQVDLVLQAGDGMRIDFLGCLVNDGLRAMACGYKMGIG